MDDAYSALTTIWRQRGLSPSHLTVRPDGTLSASDRQLSLDSKTLVSPQLATVAGAELVEEPLEVGDELGRGGMGVVHVAKQTALRRDVQRSRELVDRNRRELGVRLGRLDVEAARAEPVHRPVACVLRHVALQAHGAVA